MNDPATTGDYRDVLPFWQARSTWAAIIGTVALILGLFDVKLDAVALTDKVFEGVSALAYAWAYAERLRGAKRLVLFK